MKFMGQTAPHVPARERIAAALQRATAGTRAPAKVLARVTGRSPEMAEKWLRAENVPSADALIAACREFDDVWEEVRAMCGREPSNVERAAETLALLADELRGRR